MRPLHTLLALLLVCIWGFNFVVIHEGLDEIPPITLCVFRFVLVSFPAVFFIRRPDVSWRMLIAFAMTMFVLQFSFLFGAMSLGLSPGISSIALQLHVFVTIGLAMVILGERPGWFQIAGALLALSGLILIGVHSGGEVPIWGLLGMLAGATSWGVANIISKKLGQIDMLALIVWGGLLAIGPMILIALVFEGSTRMIGAVTHLSWLGVGTIAYIVYPVTLFGFSVWSWLLGRYQAASVVPMTLLVPIVGIGSSVLLLGETLQSWKIIAALLVCGGLAVNLFGPRLMMLMPFGSKRRRLPRVTLSEASGSRNRRSGSTTSGP